MWKWASFYQVVQERLNEMAAFDKFILYRSNIFVLNMAQSFIPLSLKTQAEIQDSCYCFFSKTNFLAQQTTIVNFVQEILMSTNYFF